MYFVSSWRRAMLVALGFALACASAGCSDSGSGESVGQNEAELNTNDQAAFNFFVGKGLTAFQAAGIVGNLDQESNVNPNAVQQGGPGRGIAQWSVGGRWDTDSNDNAQAYATKQGLSVWSLQLQLEFIWYELTTFSGYGLASLKNTTNVTNATIVFETDFEGCGNCQQATRISYAQAVLNAYGAIPYGASFVSQSFPFATTPMTMTEGEVVPSYIELKNTGTKTWDSNTKIGTTQPRDRASAFADSSWLSTSRLDAVKGTVAPGGTYKFTFNLTAPMKPGTYDEFFGVVQEGVAWFSDPGQGGPADNDLEVKIIVVKGDAGAPPPDAGTKTDAGTKSDAGAVENDSGTGNQGDAGFPQDPNGTAGCSVGPSRNAAPPWGTLASVLVVVGIVRASRRRTEKSSLE